MGVLACEVGDAARTPWHSCRFGIPSLREFPGNFLQLVVAAAFGHREGADYMRVCNTANSRLCYKMHRVLAPPCFLPAGILLFPQLRAPLDQVPASRSLAC